MAGWEVLVPGIGVSFGTSLLTLEQGGWRGAGQLVQVPSLHKVSVATDRV